MIILALLILPAIVCGYSWVMHRIRTTRPKVYTTTVPANRHIGSSLDDFMAECETTTGHSITVNAGSSNLPTIPARIRVPLPIYIDDATGA